MRSQIVYETAETYLPKITNDAEYESALKAVEPLLNSKQGTSEYDAAMALTDAIEVYENSRYDLPDPTAEATAEFRRDQRAAAIRAAA